MVYKKHETIQVYKSQFDQDVVLISIERADDDFIVRVFGDQDTPFQDFDSASEFAESKLQKFYK